MYTVYDDDTIVLRVRLENKNKCQEGAKGHDYYILTKNTKEKKISKPKWLYTDELSK